MNKTVTVSPATVPASIASYSSRVILQWVRPIAILEMDVPPGHRLGQKLSPGQVRGLRTGWFQTITGVAPGTFDFEGL
jgi:hypothetical protein